VYYVKVICSLVRGKREIVNIEATAVRHAGNGAEEDVHYRASGGDDERCLVVSEIVGDREGVALVVQAELHVARGEIAVDEPGGESVCLSWADVHGLCEGELGIHVVGVFNLTTLRLVANDTYTLTRHSFLRGDNQCSEYRCKWRR
jgi:hypothetical protein